MLFRFSFFIDNPAYFQFLYSSSDIKVDLTLSIPDEKNHDDGGRVVFVSGGVPGDVVDVRVTQEKGRFAHGTVKSVVEASPLRVDIPHPYVEQCGGCPWANLAYKAQLTAKRANVTDALVRIGRFPQERAEALVAACVASPKPWGYRNKIELAVATQQGRTTIGMHDRLGRGIAAFRSCPLLDARHDKLARSIVGALSYLTGKIGRAHV